MPWKNCDNCKHKEIAGWDEDGKIDDVICRKGHEELIGYYEDCPDYELEITVADMPLSKRSLSGGS